MDENTGDSSTEHEAHGSRKTNQQREGKPKRRAIRAAKLAEETGDMFQLYVAVKA